MIPQEIIDFTYSSHFGYVGSRDENMVSTVRRCWGTHIGDTNNVLIFFVVQAQYEQMLRNFDNNGRVSLSLVEWPSFRSYQFKGQFLKARAMAPDEMVFQQQFQEKLMALLKAMGFPDEIAERIVHQTDLAIEFKVETIFDQTPGPGAGKAVELAK